LSSTLLDPRVIDASTVVPKPTSAIYLPVAVEGQSDNVGTATVAVPASFVSVDSVNAAFGPASSLSRIINAVLARGGGPVIGVASAKGATPTLAQRQTAWALLESDRTVRVRLTDSEVQTDLVGLAQSVANANLLYHKQIALVGLASGTTKANLIAGATALAAAGLDPAQRTALVGPGVYDENGVLRGGSFAAACVAAEVAKNSDPSNDLDRWQIPLLTGVELDTAGMPVFRRKVVAGAAVNDYEDLLQGGVSPLQPSLVPGGAQTSHLRTVYITNTSYDNLYTRIIVDQIFIDVRDYILDSNFLRAANTEATRARIASGVSALLNERRAWIRTVTQSDGSQGYNVSVTSSPDNRQVTVGYEGIIVRGINTVRVAANLSIPT
jgi:hypothetical protein